jgi:myo-inositol-1(or 4)-monophosphatase
MPADGVPADESATDQAVADALDERFAVGSALIVEAADLALGYFRRLDSLTISPKGRQDMASEADVDTEVLIRDHLAARFPGDAFLGEETGRGDVAGSRGIWVVDPIDGTQPFVSGMSSWCVSIAFVLDGRVELGFVASPARDELFIGRRGAEATLNGRPISVSSARALDEGIVAVGYSPRIGADDIVPLFDRLLRRGAMFYRDGSGALALAYVACGRLIGYIEPHINAWDCLGALALLEAAGGISNDFLAGDGLWRGGPLIACPPAIYPALEAVFSGIDPA